MAVTRLCQDGSCLAPAFSLVQPEAAQFAAVQGMIRPGSHFQFAVVAVQWQAILFFKEIPIFFQE